MSYRILEYELAIMQSAIDLSKIKNKEYKVPLVIPIVLYTGNKKWDAKKHLEKNQEKFKNIEIKFINIKINANRKIYEYRKYNGFTRKNN